MFVAQVEWGARDTIAKVKWKAYDTDVWMFVAQGQVLWGDFQLELYVNARLTTIYLQN